MKTYKKITEVKITALNQSKMLDNYIKCIKKASKVNKKYFGPSPSPKNMSQMGSEGINTRTTPRLP